MILRGSSDVLEMRRSEAGLERPLVDRVVMCTEMFVENRFTGISFFLKIRITNILSGKLKRNFYCKVQ